MVTAEGWAAEAVVTHRPSSSVLFDQVVTHRGDRQLHLTWDFHERIPTQSAMPTNWLAVESPFFDRGFYQFRVEVRQMERPWTSPMHIQFGWWNIRDDPLIRHIAAPLPERLQDRSLPAPGLLAQLLVGKYCDHLPLYRQEQIFSRRHQVQLPRQTFARWVALAADWLKPIYEQIRTGVLAGGYVQVDETPIDYLAPGHGRARQGYLWTGHRPGGDVFYRWETSRAARGKAIDELRDNGIRAEAAALALTRIEERKLAQLTPQVELLRQRFDGRQATQHGLPLGGDELEFDFGRTFVNGGHEAIAAGLRKRNQPKLRFKAIFFSPARASVEHIAKV